METSYVDFVASKRRVAAPVGRNVVVSDVSAFLFPFQRAIVRWACRRGRAAVWADCGMGKTLVQLEWARLMGGRCIVLAPLAVARQTEDEARKLGMTVPYVRSASEIPNAPGTHVTNYDRLDAFDGMEFDSVVLDESSILKGFDRATRTKLINRFAATPYRLCCTATPAPNDYLELGNHAQFLGIMTWREMAATFFVHDTQDDGGNRGHQSSSWRLKGHAQDEFWKWLVSWGIFIRRPSDIGFEDNGFVLPELRIQDRVVTADGSAPAGLLFNEGLHGVQDRNRVRRATKGDRVRIAAEMINADREQWIAWVGLNDEGRELAALVPDAVNVEGSDDPETKADVIMRFARGEVRVLISKIKIAGLGMNFQNCARQVFVGIGDSYEGYYQGIRRSWRFGQKRPVNVTIVVSDLEEEIVENVRRKERDADKMSAEMVARMSDLEKHELEGSASEEAPYRRDVASAKDGTWMVYLGDCVEVMREVVEASIDFSVYSPPFSALYTYSNSPRDMGNCSEDDTFFRQFDFFARELLRVTKPGRITACHVSQLSAMLSREGFIGLKDFRGRCIDTFNRAGWIHHGEVVIDKNPQVQAIRTKAKALLFAQLRKDSSWSRPGLCDFLLLFRKPGENAVPVVPKITNDDWILWAHPVWYDVRETNVLHAAEGRDERDEKHICPLQLDVIDRAVQLWSNPGETVLSPFCGIGSEGYQSILRERKFVGIELKESYWRTAIKNLERASAEMSAGRLF